MLLVKTELKVLNFMAFIVKDQFSWKECLKNARHKFFMLFPQILPISINFAKFQVNWAIQSEITEETNLSTYTLSYQFAKVWALNDEKYLTLFDMDFF